MTQPQAILCGLAAFFGWVLSDTAIKLGAESALPPFAIVGIMGSVGAACVLGMVLRKKDITTLRAVYPRTQLVIGLVSVAINYANVIALKHLPLTIFYVVVFTAPLVIALASVFLKHEVLTKTKIACIIAGFIGVLIAIAPRLEAGGEWIGYVAGTASVIGFATYTVLVKKIAPYETAESLLFWNGLVLGTCGVMRAWPAIAGMKGKMLAIVVAGSLCNIASNAFYNRALRHTTSTNVAQLHYTQIISGAAVGYLIWHEMPTWNLAAGSALIVASGIIVAARAGKVKS